MSTFEIFVLLLCSVSTLTAVAAFAISVTSCRKVASVKIIDMRVELRKTVNDCHGYTTFLNTFIPLAKKSRERVNAAFNRYSKDVMQQWEAQADIDLSRALTIHLNLPPANNQFKTLPMDLLEDTLVEVHAYKNELTAIKEKYEASYAADEEMRREHREDMSLGLL